jgi:membrane protease YdiL (CAAX protease family)
MLEIALALYLLLVLPAQQLWRSLRAAGKPAATRTRQRRYWATTRWLAVLLAVLAAAVLQRGRTPAELGLDWPPGPAGLGGMAFSLLLLVVLCGGDMLYQRRIAPEARTQVRAGLTEDKMMPRTGAELASFLVMSLVVGAGWEILYRGFLLLVLTPHVGLAGAVVLAALAYGVSHGFDTRKQFVGSIVSAFLFTIAYAFTHSLWWLILVHIGLAAVAGISTYRHLKDAPVPKPEQEEEATPAV